MEIKIPGQDAEDIIEQLLGGSEEEALMQTLTKEKALVRIRWRIDGALCYHCGLWKRRRR
jgi:hypothetical protein